jgi:hypothetical protein
MDEQIISEKKKGSADFKAIANKFPVIWEKYHKFLLVIIFLGLVSFGGYIWYDSFYSGAWSEDKKQQYLNSQEKSVTLKEKEFKRVLDNIDQRKQEYQGEYQQVKDVFQTY